MILVADEGIDREIVAQLRKDGHEVFYIAEMLPSVSDSDILDLARKKNSVLITSDKDFGELVYRQGRIHTGVILLRLAGLRNKHKAILIAAALKEHGSRLSRSFSVISPGLFRTRPENPAAS
jgi:predicted nuclease of predicted toxin-antitoxin system